MIPGYLLKRSFQTEATEETRESKRKLLEARLASDFEAVKIQRQKEDARYSPRLRAIFGYIGGGCILAASAAFAAFPSGLGNALVHFARSPPYISIIANLGVVISAIVPIYSIPKENRVSRHLIFGFLASTFGISLASWCLVLSGDLVLQELVAAAVMVGTLATGGVLFPSKNFFHAGGPLFLGLGATTAIIVSPLVLPTTDVFEFLALFGGVVGYTLAVFVHTDGLVRDSTKSAKFDPMKASLFMCGSFSESLPTGIIGNIREFWKAQRK